MLKWVVFLPLLFGKGDDGRSALVLDSTIFHPQGGGQPADTGFITVGDREVKFVVEDVRSRDGIVRLMAFIMLCFSNTRFRSGHV